MTRKPRLTAGLRIKDGERYVTECLSRLSELVDQIVILDDGSTDRTVELCRRFPKVVHLISWPKRFFHEGLDRNVVLALAKDTRPDWILCLDVDEVFEARAAEALPALLAIPEVNGWSFPRCHFWRGRTHYRVDGHWGKETRDHLPLRLFRNQPGLHFPCQQAHGARVLGLEGPTAVSDLRIKHYGYHDPEEARAKYARYLSLGLPAPLDYAHLITETGLQLMEWQE